MYGEMFKMEESMDKRLIDKKVTMKELPIEQQPYEKFRAKGADALSDAELLAIIIRTGTKNERAIDLSKRILSMPNCDNNILNIIELSLKDLLDINGIGMVKAVQIKCIAELSRRISKTAAAKRLHMNNPETIADYYMEDLRFTNQEVAVLLMLDTKNRLIGEKIISKGTVKAALISPREIFVEALASNAVNIILLHNHPSKDPSPSREDLLVTKRVKAAGDMIGINLLDHIIIGDKSYTSLKEQGVLD